MTFHITTIQHSLRRQEVRAVAAWSRSAALCCGAVWSIFSSHSPCYLLVLILICTGSTLRGAALGLLNFDINTVMNAQIEARGSLTLSNMSNCRNQNTLLHATWNYVCNDPQWQGVLRSLTDQTVHQWQFCRQVSHFQYIDVKIAVHKGPPFVGQRRRDGGKSVPCT